MTDIRIKIFGALEQERQRLFYKVLGKPTANERILLCDYSEFDIPIGYIFNRIIGEEEIVVNINCKIILKSVSQQWALPFDVIPNGHKTVSKFEFIGGIPSVINELPALPGWTYLKKSLYFQ